MIVRLLKPWQFRKVGHVFNDMPDGQANMLIKRGLAEPVKGEPKPEPKNERKRQRVGA